MWSLPYASTSSSRNARSKANAKAIRRGLGVFGNAKEFDGRVCTANLKRVASMNAQCSIFYPPLSWVQLLRRGYHLIQDVPRCSASRRAPTKSQALQNSGVRRPLGCGAYAQRA
jgi:hypothetical protein